MPANNVDAFSANDAFPSGGGGGSGVSTDFATSYFGSGYDGNVTITNATIMGQERQYNNLTITGTGSLAPSGRKVFVKDTLTIAAGGSLQGDGQAATGATAGASWPAVNYAGSTGVGATGRSTTGQGAQPSSVGNMSPNNAGVLPVGGQGGAAGANVGGLGGAGTWPLEATWMGTAFNGNPGPSPNSPGTAFNGGSGGGAGGCDITLGAATSGGGGGGARHVMVYAKTIVNQGRISAIGGKGGDATSVAGVAGGGGGGGGGNIAIFTKTAAASLGSIQTNGGAGGAGANGGTSGSSGTQGATSITVLA